MITRTLPVLLLLTLIDSSAVAGRRGTGPDGQQRDPSAVIADLKVDSGQVLIGAQIAEQCMEAHPDNLDCLAVHARARSRLGQCSKLDATFAQLRRSIWWDAPTALAEGMCRLREGDLSTAFVAMDEALVLLDRDPVPRFERSIAAIRAGWTEVYTSDIAELDDADKADWMADLLRAWTELQAGDERLDATLALNAAWPTTPGLVGRPQWALLDCRRWLDVGDPFEAERVARASLNTTVGQTRLAACRVEALRRVGDDSEAWFVLTRPWHAAASSVALDAVRVRSLVDAGQLAEASALAARIPRIADPDVVASSWYLARALGHDEEAEVLSATYDAISPVGRTGSSLASLTPLVTPAARRVP